jgi:MFS family permease
MRDRIAGLIASSTVALSVLRNGAVRRLMLAFFAYNMVELGAWTTILVYAYVATGPASVGVVAVVQLLPSALLAPLLAGFGDRFPRASVLAAWYAIQAVAVGGTGLAILAGLPPIAVYAVSTLATIAITQTRPLQAAILPEVVDSPGELTAANALASVGEGVGAFAGPLAVGLLLTVTTIGVTFLAGGLLLLSVTLLIAGLRGHAGGATAGAPDPGDEPELAPSSILAGIRAVTRDPDLLVVMALLTGRLMIFGGLEVLLVLLAIDLLGMGEPGAGFLTGAMGIGLIAGGGGAFALAGRRRLAPWLGVGAVVVGVPIALVGFAPGSGSAALLLGVVGVGLALLDVAGQTLLQRITPDAVRARVFGALEGLLLLGEALGSVVVGPIALVIGLRGAAIVLGLALPVLAGLAVLRFTRIDARSVVPVAELAALRRVPIFAPVGGAELEALARHLVAVPFVPGQVMIREGDPGDRWYLVHRGRLRVTAAGRELRELGPGDGFGEIALLHDRPRTATVEAIEAGSAWALQREEFLAVVVRTPASLAEAERVAAARLAGSRPG